VATADLTLRHLRNCGPESSQGRLTRRYLIDNRKCFRDATPWKYCADTTLECYAAHHTMRGGQGAGPEISGCRLNSRVSQVHKKASNSIPRRRAVHSTLPSPFVMAENGERSQAENLTLQTDILTLTRVPSPRSDINFSLFFNNNRKSGLPPAETLLSSSMRMSRAYRLTCRLQLTCKFIAHNIRRATLINLLGLAGASNATGDDQKKLDVLGNQIFIDTMKNCGKVGIIVSEEEDDLIVVKTRGARYAVVCDPIDGSSNLDAGVSVGTIFGIYRIPDDIVDSPSAAAVLRPGTEMLVAGYCMSSQV
jgi:Fructose-1-6-bisphosphatase, N-terminal domain